MDILTTYYSHDNSDMALREMIRTLQKRAAHVQARLIRGEYKKVKKTFKMDGEIIALNTQTSLNSIQAQIDTAIRGKVSKAFQKTVEANLPIIHGSNRLIASTRLKDQLTRLILSLLVFFDYCKP